MVEQHFSLTAFLHGKDIAILETKKANGTFLNTTKNNSSFEGLRIDTFANHTSAITDGQYQAYCRKLNLSCSIKSASNRAMKGICGNSKAVGLVVIQVPFKELDVVLEVAFLIIDKNIPTPLSMKYMLNEGLDISVQSQYVSLSLRRHRLTKKYYFLIHR